MRNIIVNELWYHGTIRAKPRYGTRISLPINPRSTPLRPLELLRAIATPLAIPSLIPRSENRSDGIPPRGSVPPQDDFLTCFAKRYEFTEPDRSPLISSGYVARSNCAYYPLKFYSANRFPIPTVGATSPVTCDALEIMTARIPFAG